MKILLVEDSHDFRHKMKELLEDLDHQILEAGDGIEGYDLIKNHADIDLIISDLHMPNMDGLSMCKKLKDEAFETAPIMMVTTEANPQLRKDGMEAGVSIWMIKPVSDKKFLTMVEKILNR